MLIRIHRFACELFCVLTNFRCILKINTFPSGFMLTELFILWNIIAKIITRHFANIWGFQIIYAIHGYLINTEIIISLKIKTIFCLWVSTDSITRGIINRQALYASCFSTCSEFSNLTLTWYWRFLTVVRIRLSINTFSCRRIDAILLLGKRIEF